MKFRIVDCEQRSPEWFAARCGAMTGSAAPDMMATIKSGEAAARRDLRYRLAIERLTGQVEELDLSNNAAVMRGVEKEPAGRMRFEEEAGVDVRLTGFLRHIELPFGVSLDGDIDGFRETLEIKCPKTATHIETIERGTIPPRYVWQLAAGAWLTGAEAANFVSFDDRLPPGLDYFHVRVSARDLPLEEFDRALRKFLTEVDDLTETLRRKAA